MYYTIHAVIQPGDQTGFVAECHELPIVTQGATLDEVTQNLRDAIALHLEGEDLRHLGFAANPTVTVNYELGPLRAQA